VSIKVQALIWAHAPYRGNTLLAFLALGDWADDGGYCWPKMATLAKKSRQSLRNAHYSVKTLEGDGFLTVDAKRGARGKNNFQINMQKLHTIAAMQKKAGKCANGDSQICKTEQHNKEEPSLEPSGIQHGSAALIFWIKFKDELKTLLPDEDWRLWVRPALLLREIGGHLLLALPPATKIITAYRTRERWVRDLLEPYGYSCSATTYPDDFTLENLRSTYPEQFENLTPEVKKRMQRVAAYGFIKNAFKNASGRKELGGYPHQA
jgi:hypothetical protein